ncbi:MAG TPA: AAA family ATPase [Actinocrinis sp.]|nr:AAA family ATPase [Actinocrinis sp.]
MESACAATPLPFGGREAQLAAFDEALAAADCRGVVIAGPAGTGRSRLAEEVLARARRGGCRADLAVATAAAAAMPLGAIGHLLPGGTDFRHPAEAFAAVAANLPANDRRRWVVVVDDAQLLDPSSAVLLGSVWECLKARKADSPKPEPN